MFMSQRVFLSDSGAFSDLTLNTNDYRSGSTVIPMEAADYLYIASERPFNSRYISLSVPNDVAVTMKVEIWNGSSWFEPVDLVDDTKGFTQSGYIRFNLDPDGSNATWKREANSKDVVGVGAQADVFKMYWMRISFDLDLLSTTALAHIGSLFSSDADLFGYYPDLRNTDLMNAWETGKSTWTEQGLAAASEIIRKLRQEGQLKDFDGFGIMEPDLFNEASIHKTAQIIYGGMGVQAFGESALAAFREYKEAIDIVFNVIDLSGDGTIQESEKNHMTGFFTR